MAKTSDKLDHIYELSPDARACNKCGWPVIYHPKTLDEAAKIRQDNREGETVPKRMDA